MSVTWLHRRSKLCPSKELVNWPSSSWRNASPKYSPLAWQHTCIVPWVEGTLVRLFDGGVSSQMWKLMSQFLRGTQSQMRVGSSLSHPWFDSGNAQGRVLSPLLFNLLVNGLAAAMRRSAPGAQFFPSGSHPLSTLR